VQVPLGLYVHIPFCAAICNYCNFNRGLFDAELKTRYVAALLEEIQRAAEPQTPADTIFFGGGTPSLLEPSEIADIIDRCRRSFDLAADAEVTLECNPETVTPARLELFRAAGVNRLSYGVQSFHDDELIRLSRLHSAARAREAFAMARSAGFDNISLDLMMWLPQQSIRQWLESVDALIDVGPDHASLYLLEVYPNAPLRDEMARSEWSLAPDDDAAEMYLGAMDRLDAAGYQQYEISNVAKPGRQSCHNLKYWEDGEWLGFGCGAHSTRGGARWKNISSTTEYIATVKGGGQPPSPFGLRRPGSPAPDGLERPAIEVDRRQLSRQERLEDALFTGLRLTRGVDLAAVKARYGVDVWERYGSELQPFIDEGLLVYDRSLRLTRAGMLLAHEIMTVFISSNVR
jgi:oxygen-independent coproporphyrinogen III oxidase